MDYRTQYRNWLDSLSTNRQCSIADNYSKLLNTLDSMEYRYDIYMDENREGDGINMRYLFARTNYGRNAVNDICEDLARPCTVYEMMLGVAYKLNKTLWLTHNEFDLGSYLWDMIQSLGLDIYTDDAYDEGAVVSAVTKALNHDYDPDTGAGGFFTVSQHNHVNKDLREVELWILMNLYTIDKA